MCIWSAVAKPLPPSAIAAVSNTAPVPNPRFVLAVPALAKSDKLLDFNALNPIAVVVVVA